MPSLTTPLSMSDVSRLVATRRRRPVARKRRCGRCRTRCYRSAPRDRFWPCRRSRPATELRHVDAHPLGGGYEPQRHDGVRLQPRLALMPEIGQEAAERGEAQLRLEIGGRPGVGRHPRKVYALQRSADTGDRQTIAVTVRQRTPMMSAFPHPLARSAARRRGSSPVVTQNRRSSDLARSLQGSPYLADHRGNGHSKELCHDFVQLLDAARYAHVWRIGRSR